LQKNSFVIFLKSKRRERMEKIKEKQFFYKLFYFKKMDKTNSQLKENE